MEFLTENYRDMELSTQIIIREAMKRNVAVDVMDLHDNFIRLKRNDKTEYVKQATRTSADTYIAPLIMENKFVTKKILEENGIRVPYGKIYQNRDDAENDFESFGKKEIVVKPNKTNFGIGISILRDGYRRQNYKEALNIAFRHDSSVIVEEYIHGMEYRFLIINDEVVGILHRVPANVTGDGIHSVQELVEIKNRDPLRGKGYKTPLEKIRLEEMELEFLTRQGKSIHTIPENAETVFLRKNSNISTGGDSLDFTDAVRDEYKEIAVRAVKAAGAKICGADIIIEDINAKPSDNNYAVIELNFNPALHIHSFPYKGINRQPEKKVLDLLGFREE
jgi:glutamate--cysteine ligase